MTAKEEGLLLKNYLIDLGISKRMLADIKFDGGDLLINGEHVTVRYKLHNGDRLTILFPEEKVSEGLKPAPIPLDILFEDEHVLVLNKKPYIPSIPSREHPEHSIANGLLHHYAEQSVRLTVHLVNRLDRDTSGVMLVQLQASLCPQPFIKSAKKWSGQTNIQSVYTWHDLGKVWNHSCKNCPKRR